MHSLITPPHVPPHTLHSTAAQTPKATSARVARASTVKVTAQAPVDRRQALGLLAGALALIPAAASQAITQPAQESLKRKGRNSTFASASGYGLEGFNTGTKKRGLGPKEKAEAMEKAKERILEEVRG